MRVSARKLALRGYTFGQAGATITAQAGKLQADLTELELNSGNATAQVMAIMSEAMPRYALRGKIENVDAGCHDGAVVGSAGAVGSRDADGRPHQHRLFADRNHQAAVGQVQPDGCGRSPGRST